MRPDHGKRLNDRDLIDPTGVVATQPRDRYTALRTPHSALRTLRPTPYQRSPLVPEQPERLRLLHQRADLGRVLAVEHALQHGGQ